MINTKIISTETRAISRESLRESSSSQLREKKEKRSHQLKKPTKMRKGKKKNLTAMSVSKKRSKCLQKNWLSLIGLNTLF